MTCCGRLVKSKHFVSPQNVQYEHSCSKYWWCEILPLTTGNFGFLCCCRPQVPESSTTGSSSCSAGRLLWHVRLLNCPTSQESPGRSSLSPLTTQTSLNGQPTITTTTSIQRRTQVNVSFNLFCLFPLCSTSLSSLFLEDAQFEMDIWREEEEDKRDLQRCFFVYWVERLSAKMRSLVLLRCNPLSDLFWKQDGIFFIMLNMCKNDFKTNTKWCIKQCLYYDFVWCVKYLTCKSKSCDD